VTGDVPEGLPFNLHGEWELDAEPLLEEPGPATFTQPVPQEPEPSVPSPVPRSVFRVPQSESEESVPPSPEQIIEAMLFVGGHPLTAEAACSAIRGLTPGNFLTALDALTRRYRAQRRPYTIQPRDGGFTLTLLPLHRGVRDRLFGGLQETKLSQPALDVLSVVAYRQPIAKQDVDAVRGTDSGPILRQLVRLNLIAVQHRADAENREVRYGTTPRFLQVFALATLDELPRLGATESASG